jgi:hypothetical protein
LKKNLATKRKSCFVHAQATLLSLQLHPKTEKGKTMVLQLKFTTILGIYVCFQNIFLPKNQLKMSFSLSFFLSFFPACTYENKGLDVNVLREQFPSQ